MLVEIIDAILGDLHKTKYFCRQGSSQIFMLSGDAIYIFYIE